MSDGIADVKPAEEATRGRSIHEIFIRCLDLYRILASYILEDDDSNAGRGIEFDRNRVLDEFGRLRIWGEETKAALEPKARSSLDDFLRDEERLSGEVKEVLNQLKIGISMAVSTVKDSSTQHSEQYGDPSGISASTSAYSSDSGSEDSRERASGRAKISKLSIILSHIFEYIQLLYHFGSLLRRPGLKGRYLRHDDSKHPDLTTIFETCHIEEKLRHWDRQAAGGVGVSPEEEKAVTEQTISERLAHESATNLHCVLSRRFARANGQRREQLKYWSKNPYQLDVSQGYETRKIVGESEIPQKMKRGGAVTEDETSTIQLEHKESRSQKSRTTVVTFSTVAESVLLGAGTETGRPQTVYAESVVAGRWSARVPPPPKPTREVNGTEQYECPYCHMNLDAKLVKDSVAWKRHVFRDLRPYSCTSMDCKNPNKLYTTRHEWKYHEMQIHRRNWVCYKCDCTFEEKAALVQHLRDNHPGNWTDRQLSVILEMSERPMDDSVILPCSLCKSQLSLAKLLDHLAAHMEEIALFVIPPTNSGPGDDTYSNDAMRTDTENGNENGGASPHSSLRFSDVAQSDRELLESSSGYGAQISDIKQYLFTHGISNEFNEPTGNMGTEQNIPRKLNDIDLILKHLLEAGSTAPGTQAHITRGQIHYLCKIAKEKFLSQPTLLELQAPIKIVGDVRGQYSSLLTIFERNGFPPNTSYLFMGNFVDAEGQSIETICLLLAYKIKYPENLFLLRGNHEVALVNRELEFFEECMNRYDTSRWRVFNEMFDSLPLAAIVEKKIFAVHSGLSPGLDSIEKIKQLRRPAEILCGGGWFGWLWNILWANPKNNIHGWDQSGDAQKSLLFGPDVVSDFLEKHGFEMLCRGHEVVQQGYEISANKQLVTIFSAPHYRGQYTNAAAVMSVDKPLVCSFNIFKI